MKTNKELTRITDGGLLLLLWGQINQRFQVAWLDVLYLLENIWKCAWRYFYTDVQVGNSSALPLSIFCSEVRHWFILCRHASLQQQLKKWWEICGFQACFFSVNLLQLLPELPSPFGTLSSSNNSSSLLQSMHPHSSSGSYADFSRDGLSLLILILISD